MTFIITFIALVIERFFHWSHLRYWRWYSKYQLWIGRRISNWPSYLLLAICVLPLVILIGVINCLFDGWLYGIPKLIFGVLVLLYCLGRENLWVQVFTCINEMQKEDPKAAIEYAQSSFGIALPKNSQAFHQELTRAIFIEAHERIFAVVFWFIILGPIGAVLYRSIALCAKESDLGLTQTAAKAQRILDWIPARLFTFLFALGGHFTDVFHLWKKDAKKGVNENDKLIAECGIAALDVEENNLLSEDGAAEKEALELIDRVFMMGLLLLAMIVIMLR